jgi:hypothetical protein
MCKLSVLVSILKNSYKNFNSHRPSQKKQPLREAATLVQENTSYLFKNEAIVCSFFPFGFFSVEKVRKRTLFFRLYTLELKNIPNV